MHMIVHMYIYMCMHMSIHMSLQLTPSNKSSGICTGMHTGVSPVGYVAGTFHRHESACEGWSCFLIFAAVHHQDWHRNICRWLRRNAKRSRAVQKVGEEISAAYDCAFDWSSWPHVGHNDIGHDYVTCIRRRI